MELLWEEAVNYHDDKDEPEGIAEESHYCADCEVLTDALRDLEQQRRETQDSRYREVISASDSLNHALNGENAYLARMKILERRRNCALEVLLKHQSLEHG